MADMMREMPQGSGAFDYLAHPADIRTPAGSNHLFNDLHVAFVPWNNGHGVRANAFWATSEVYYWRRRVTEP
jgi:hypothetical protein